MEKGYYGMLVFNAAVAIGVAIHNKNGKGLLHCKTSRGVAYMDCRNPQ